MPSLHKLLLALRGAIIIIPWLLHLLVADILLSALLPLSLVAPTLVYNLSSHIAASVWRAIQLIFTHVNGARITTSGASLPPGESAVVIANHLSWTDFYLIQALALKAGMLGRCRWFAKSQLKRVPFLGWGLYAMGMPLVTRNWTQDRAELDAVFSKIVRNRWPIWLISYSEATRFTPQKYAETVQFCKERGKPVPRHTLYPRTKGFVMTIKELRRAAQVKAVYDCTIAYGSKKGNGKEAKFLDAPSMWDTISMPRLSEKRDFHVHVERFPLEGLEGEEGLARWLEERWYEKGERLEVLRERWSRTGSFEEEGDAGVGKVEGSRDRLKKVD